MKFNFNINIRCKNEKFIIFKKWCEKANKKYQDILREVMEAGPEGRLKITQRKDQKKTIKEIYKS